MNKHQKYLFILLVVCCSLSIMRRLFTEAYEEGEEDKIDCQGYYKGVLCPTHCGYEGGEVTNHWVTVQDPKNGGKECPTHEIKSCAPTYPCPIDCEGYHEEHPRCPKYCDYKGGDVVTRKWVTTKEPNQTGEACPADMEETCPANESCISVKSVMKF
jgi:hypothetical protein